MSLEMSGRTVIDEAVDTLRRYVHAETLAAELGLKDLSTRVAQLPYWGGTV